MRDLIDRQDAIDAVEFGITYAKVFDVNTGESKELFKEGNDALKEAVERLKELPSAQPEVLAHGEGELSAQPEIIRCKDCKWFGDIGCAIEIVDDSDRPSENDFCSYAERRTDVKADKGASR